MRNLHLDDLKLGLHDLFEVRKADLGLSQAGKLYGPILALKLDAIDALPEALMGGRPLSEQLAAADARHDGFGAGIWHYTEAVLRAPDVTPALRTAAERIRATFIPNLSQLRESYADEAATAARNRPALLAVEADLKSFPLPGGKTLHDWVKSFLDAGDKLDRLLSDRSLVEAESAGGGRTSLLRTQTVGILGRFRSALRDEMEANADLPRNLEVRVFGYIDELAERRARASKARSDAGAGP
jgi:hypothetical protein